MHGKEDAKKIMKKILNTTYNRKSMSVTINCFFQDAKESDAGDDTDEEHYMKRLNAGLFTLQLVDYIMLDICHSCTSVSSLSFVLSPC